MALPPPARGMNRWADDSSAVELFGWGYAQLSGERIAGLRRSLPDWAPPETPHHFFKYADEQTLLAVQAVDDALRSCEVGCTPGSQWGVIAAPEFLGRQVTAQAVDHYVREGGQRVSPHIVPQNSLHSISGALSILLGVRGPNMGLGGGPGALADGLLAAISLARTPPAEGMWFVATGWDPEPLPDRTGRTVSAGVCHAVALAVRPPAGSGTGKLWLGRSLPVVSDDPAPPPGVVEMVAGMRAAADRGAGCSWSWRLPWGATLNVAVAPRAVRLRQAA